MAAAAIKSKPLDVTTFRAYKNGKSDDFPVRLRLSRVSPRRWRALLLA